MKDKIPRTPLEVQETIVPAIAWFRYFEVALLSGTASVIFGSLICGTALIAANVEKFEPANLILILMCIIYSAVIIFPVSLILAYPLIFFFRRASGWKKIAISTFAGTFLSTILLSSASWLFGSVLQTAAIGAVYGFIFGLSAALLVPYWCAPRTVKAVSSHRSP